MKQFWSKDMQISLKKKLIFKLSLILFFTTAQIAPHFKDNMYIATTTDTEHYKWTKSFIKSIYTHNADNKIAAIAVFDIGLNHEQRKKLETYPHVTVYDIEMVHPDLCKKFKVRHDGRMARGWYAWKPVAIKQALDMFPYVLYIDAGMRVQNSLDDIFDTIESNNYFFIRNIFHTIEPTATHHVKNKFNLNGENAWILDTHGMHAGLQGLSKKLFTSYVLPMYKLAHDLKNFEDDGSTSRGFGWGRHDQTLFSIMFRKLGLKFYDEFENRKVNNSGDYISFKKIPKH